MNKFFQFVVNVVLYGFLAWLLYDSMVNDWDPWFGFVVAFVIFVAVVVQLTPALHAKGLSPGEYPYLQD